MKYLFRGLYRRKGKAGGEKEGERNRERDRDRERERERERETGRCMQPQEESSKNVCSKMVGRWQGSPGVGVACPLKGQKNNRILCTLHPVTGCSFSGFVFRGEIICYREVKYRKPAQIPA